MAARAPSHEISTARSPGRLRAEWEAFTAAVRFLTRVPLAAKAEPTPETIARSPVYYPVVGTLLGLTFGLLLAASSLVWPIGLAVPVVLGIEIWLTGAFHEDAVADFCDAVGGGWTHEQVHAIMRDSRLGTFGVLGLTFAVALRGLAVAALLAQYGIAGWPFWGAALVASAALGRWCVLLAMVLVPPLEERPSLAQSVGRRLDWWAFGQATAWAIPAVLCFAVAMPWNFVLSVLGVTLLVRWYVATVLHSVGGMTGDCLGFLACTTQLTVLLIAAARFPW